MCVCVCVCVSICLLERTRKDKHKRCVHVCVEVAVHEYGGLILSTVHAKRVGAQGVSTGGARRADGIAKHRRL